MADNRFGAEGGRNDGRRGSSASFLGPRNEADYARASGTVARMPTFSERNGSSYSNDDRRERQNTQNGWNCNYSRGRSGGGRFERGGGEHHSRSHHNHYRGDRPYYSARDGDRRYDRGYENYGRRRDGQERDDRNRNSHRRPDHTHKGREQEWNRRPHYDGRRDRDYHHGHHPYRRPHSSVDDRHYNGSQTHSSSREHQKNNNRGGGDDGSVFGVSSNASTAPFDNTTSSVIHSQGQRGEEYRSARSSPQFRKQSGDNEELQALKLQELARLERNIKDLKESSVGGESVVPEFRQNAGHAFGSPSTTPNDGRVATTSLPTNALQQNETAHSRNDSNVAVSANQTRNPETSNENESCFDVSTDEEINMSPSNIGGEEEEGEEDAGNNQPGGNSNQATNNTNGGESDEDSDDFMLSELRDEIGVATMAFCCQNCRCWETKEKSFFSYCQIRNNCGNSGDGRAGNTSLYHKGCCHGDKTVDSDYLSPMTRAINESIEGGKKKKRQLSRSDTLHNIERSYNTAKREEKKFENDEGNAASDSSVYTNPTYSAYCQKFNKRRNTHRGPLRVLDLFSGIGSGTVVLKRLKVVPMHTYVHVEHDPIAVEVCKFNHQDDGINHQYIETFEEIYGTKDEADDGLVTALVDKHGPFDLVLSGAPCQNYSGLNASRDETSENAQYLLKVGRLVRKLDEIQGDSKVLFLSENVVFKDHKKVDKCYSGQEKVGLTPMCLDAKDFSPCKRNRFYWTNIPVKNTNEIKEAASATSVDFPVSCLDEGYGAVARLLQDEMEQLSVPVKANTFLASLGRIDDNRMIKYKKTDDTSSRQKKYQIETYSVRERERMMGLPTGYVEKPVSRLFSELSQNAFILPESEEGKSYRDFLPRKIWHFRRKTSFKFRTNDQPPFFQLALSSPKEGKTQLAFYTEDEYCKHLIGNGWSIPVAEYILGSLTDLFTDDVVMPSYDKYVYHYSWEQHDTTADV